MIPNFWEQEDDAVKLEETQAKFNKKVEIIDFMRKQNNHMVIIIRLPIY